MQRPGIAEVIQALGALSPSSLSDAPWPDDSLLAVVREDSAGLKARLNACEILLRRDRQKFQAIIGAFIIAALYASALGAKIASELNPWAFLGQGDLGPMGEHLVACGEDAVAALVPLLDLNQPAGVYGGSKESKLGNADQARICDFAAFFIARIENLPFSFHRESVTRRDEEIEQLKKRLQVGNKTIGP